MARHLWVWLLAGALCLSVAHASAGRVPTGIWFTEDKHGVVQIGPCGNDALCGTIVGLTANPQGIMPRNFQGTPQCKLTLLKDLRLEDDGRWHGTVTNPEDGQTYDAEVWVAEDGNMRLRGYIGLPLLGSTQIWPPFEGTLRDGCRFH